jgi:hypothetical protein
MIFRIKLGNWRFTFTFAPVTKVIGVNSNLPDGNHIIMWDFDDTPLEALTDELEYLQDQLDLPNIYIFTTGKKNHYIAYCFKRCTWQYSIEAVARIWLVDPSFFRFGVYRKHWTLRVSTKEGRKPKLVKTLKSRTPETASISELNSWVKGVKRGIFPHSLSPPSCSPDERALLTPFSLSLDAPAQNTRHLPMLRQSGRLR